MKTYLYIILSVFLSFECLAQDIHFSQFNASPLTLNPALTGMNGCDFRLGGNFRTQWFNLSEGNTFRTTSAFADIALGKPTYFSNYFGLGLVFVSDQAGDLNFNTNKLDVNLAYHFVIDGRAATQSVSVGIQGGFGHRGLDLSKARYNSQYDNGSGVFDPTIGDNTAINDRYFYGDAGLGILYSNSPSKKSNFNLGLAFAHVNQPNISFFDNAGGNDRLYMKLTLHGNALIPMGDQLGILPGFMFLKQGPSTEFNLSSYVKYNFSKIPSNKNAIYFGAMYRVLDAIILATRVEVGSFDIGFSYDLNVSKLTSASNLNGGPELSLIYTGCFNKNASTRYCPSGY